MLRTFILFLVSFLVTIGVGAGMMYMLKQQREQQMPETPAMTTAQSAESAPAETATPAEPAPVAPASAEDPKSEEPAPAAEEPVPAPTPAPAAEPAPAKPAVSGELAAAQAVQEALTADDPKAALEKLVADGQMTPEAAASLAAWRETHSVAKVEEVGNARREDGSRVTRYRIVSAEGGEDMLVSVVTKADGSTLIESAQSANADKTVLTAESDSLAVAEGFVEAVRRGDMATARKMVTGTQVSDATVAGLCMIFEEGEFKLRETAPIRNAFENATNSGFIVYVEGKNTEKPANIGLEETRTEKGWGVSGVSLDALLSMYEATASAEGGHYFPIVKNPKGGDSLALFFGFNEAALTPRSQRQLQIVAELLKASHGHLNISGHTDDVGSEAYNQKLSERRAEAVREALIGFGVEPEQVSAEGMGKSQPRRTYSTEDSEQQIDYIRGENRRAEIYLDFE